MVRDVPWRLEARMEVNFGGILSGAVLIVFATCMAASPFLVLHAIIRCRRHWKLYALCTSVLLTAATAAYMIGMRLANNQGFTEGLFSGTGDTCLSITLATLNFIL